MVDISELVEEQEESTVPPSQERLLDAEEIESAAQTCKRPSAKIHLEALAKKLRKESDALRRMETANGNNSGSSNNDEESSPDKVEETTPAAPPAAATTTPETPAPTPIPTTTAATPATAPTTGKYVSIDRFSFDFGEYNSAFVTLYIPLPGVGNIPKDHITCQFTKGSFDLIVHDLQGKSYRLFKDNLEKDINPEKSKFIVKADKVIVKLAKIKGEYGSYDYWSKLTDSKGKKKAAASSKENPQASIMQLMKDMYEDGDDNMKKVIGETLMKQQRGELGKDPAGGVGGGFGDLKLNDDDDI